MPRKTLNRHQKAAFRPREHRVRGGEIARLIALAYSDDPEDRLEAAENLCPCHLRRWVEEAWQALYRMMEDEDVRVRRAAWHTLENGGCPTDPALEPIFDRAVENESDVQVLCAAGDTPVRVDYQTELTGRFAFICKECDRLDA